MSKVEHISSLEWKRKNGALVAQLSDGDLSIVSASGTHTLWFHRSGAWGTNEVLGTHVTAEAALAAAKTWVGDDE